MTKRGTIICHTRALPFGGRHISYSWEGGDVVEMEGYDPLLPSNVTEGVLFQYGPFQLRVLKFDWARCRLLAIRERPVKAKLYYTFYCATRCLDRAYRLLIITLYVWGLARYDRGRVPSWRDVKGTGRIAAWADRRKDAKRKAIIDRINQRLKEETQE